MANENDIKNKTTLRLNDKDIDNIPTSKKSATRTSLNLSDWDNIKRDDNSEEKDRYYVPPELIPEGFSVEWKRTEVLGKPDRKNLVKVESAGWRPAPADIFRDLLPSGYTGDTVEDGEGMMLMIRPLKFTEAAMKENERTAVQKVKDYEDATMNRITGHKDVPNKVTAFSRSYEKGSIAVPD